MGTGQTLLTIMAMMMLSRMALSINQSNAQSGDAVELAAYRITATSLGTSMIQEAMGMAFDQQSDTVGISTVSSFTPANKLGPDGSEKYPLYNDFDDFNALHKVDSISGSAVYVTDVKVEYVSITGNTITTSATQTYNKRITVAVSSPFLPDTMRFYNIFSYWFFR